MDYSVDGRNLISSLGGKNDRTNSIVQKREISMPGVR